MNDPEYQRKWWQANKEKYRERRAAYEKEYRQANRARSMFVKTRSRAKKLGIPFDLEEGDIVIPDCCPILGVPFFSPGRYTPTVDRKVPSLGYTKGNVWVVTKLANVMKNDASPDELARFAAWINKSTRL